ncbi:Uncharacterised protein [Streptococcus dysgalactiae subsp. equisimilis]|uniref:Uncharacterized protein n=1 Tax=Streptococcus dysgalactiae subsp. equisimilis TaxID=119602 RepID=A0AAE9QUA2_STREQ|nr:Uncharacterised protein [Streptococcus dysgalactiae subsp. equisimilis]
MEQPEEEAQSLALKSESYTKGSQDIFAYETNVDLNNQVVIFNLKKTIWEIKTLCHDGHSGLYLATRR